jgi:hypothetical protein
MIIYCALVHIIFSLFSKRLCDDWFEGFVRQVKNKWNSIGLTNTGVHLQILDKWTQFKHSKRQELTKFQPLSNVTQK